MPTEVKWRKRVMALPARDWEEAARPLRSAARPLCCRQMTTDPTSAFSVQTSAFSVQTSALQARPPSPRTRTPLSTPTSSVIVQPQVIKDENDIKDEFYDSFSVRCSPCHEPKPPKRPRFRAPCEFCLSVYPGESFPFRFCTFCGVNPSWHHGRCCPRRPWA